MTATRGTWTQKPSSYTYGWNRCDPDGACAGIVGATAKSYTVTNADVGHTLRVTVTAHNAAGATAITSNQTATVPPSGCPVGSGVIQISQLAPPAQLVIAHASASARQSLVEVTSPPRPDPGMRRPSGAGRDVFATAIPYNQFANASGTRGRTEPSRSPRARQAGFPASPPPAARWRCSPARRSAGAPASRRRLRPPDRRVPPSDTRRRDDPTAAPRSGWGASPQAARERSSSTSAGRRRRGGGACPSRHADRLEHPGDERNPVGEQREEERPGGERRDAPRRWELRRGPPKRGRGARARRRWPRRRAVRHVPRARR